MPEQPPIDDQDKDKQDKDHRANTDTEGFAGTPDVKGPSFAAPETRVKDLSHQIEATIGREPGEQVRCRRVFGNYYRCNWWGRCETDGYDGPRVLAWSTFRVVRSQMLCVTEAAGRLDVRRDREQ